jgi:hypothetical protein
MNNFDFGNMALGAAIVGFLDLIIVILVKTETILTSVEKIKSILKLDYRSRAKRNEDEVKLLKKYNSVAQERVRQTFTSINLWDCNWTWNWNQNFMPVEIRGFCTGNKGYNVNMEFTFYECNHPVYPAFAAGPEKRLNGYTYLGIYCTDEGVKPHKQSRAYFEVPIERKKQTSPQEICIDFLEKAIMTERDKRIAQEIKKMQWQFWR